MTATAPAIVWHRAGSIEFFRHDRHVAGKEGEHPHVTIRRVGEHHRYHWLTLPEPEFADAIRRLAALVDGDRVVPLGQAELDLTTTQTQEG